MPDLAPIPIPSKQRWQDFRVAYLPWLTFAVAVAMIAWIWANYVEPSTIIGEVEMVHANIINTAAGTVQQLNVDRLQTVTNGQPLVVLSPVDPAQLAGELAAAEADLRLMKARMDIDKTRNLDAFSRLRVNLLSEQLNLELARIRLQQADGELERAQKLRDENLIPSGYSSQSNFGYDVALRDRDAARAEAGSREKSVAELQAGVDRLQASGVVRIDPADAAVEQAILAQRERIERLRMPVALRSPLDGFVSDINYRAGQKVMAGQTLVVISAGRSDRILAWVQQPINVRPHPGDSVEVRRMTMGGTKFRAKVIEVGAQLEPVSPMLRSPTANPERIEVGLPLLVKGPEVLGLIPGEPVLLRVVK